MERPYHEVYADFALSAQSLATMLIGVVLLSSDLRDKLVRQVLGLIWVLTGFTHYFNYLGGSFGVLMTLACVGQACALMVNWSNLLRPLDFCQLKVDMQRVNTTAAVLGASTLLVRPT